MKTFDPKQHQLIVGTNIISGFAKDTFIKVARAEDAFVMDVGVDGEGTRSKSNNKMGTFEITLMQSSASNDVLSALALSDELSNGGLVPVMLRDASGRSLYAAEQAYIKKIPDSERARVVGSHVWVLETDSLNMFHGGNN